MADVFHHFYADLGYLESRIARGQPGAFRLNGPGSPVQGSFLFALLLLFSKNLKKTNGLGKGLLLALATGVTGGAGNIFLYRALGHYGPASLVFPIISMAPLIPVLLTPFLFKEKIHGLQATGIAVALIAIVLLNTSPSASFNVPGFSLFSEWMLYTLPALFIFGITYLTQKGATYFISDELSTIAFAVGFVLLDIFLFLTDHSRSWDNPGKAGWVSVFIGILMGGGTLTLFVAYRHGKASIVTPFSQLYPIITVLVAVPLYHETIDLLREIGIIAALAAGVILSIERSEPHDSAESSLEKASAMASSARDPSPGPRPS